ncbi:MAG: SctK family type III secretion system sorting platform protein [Puniceicoccales bacterium]|jgi:hypothetical protein|nr:SctK family type III secretion system sorting platform protein [Puniceicoccales bacterium]
MGKVGTAQLRQALGEDPEGVVRMLHLIYEPITFLHPSRLEELFPSDEVLEILGSSRRPWLAANQFVRKRLRLKLTQPTPLTEPRHSLFFEPLSILRQLALHAGAILLSEEIRRVIRRRERNELLACLGKDIYNFVLRKAFFFRVHSMPLAFGEDGRSLAERTVTAGRRCVAACLFDLPPALRERFPLKFPVDERWPVVRGTGKQEADVLWQFLVRLRRHIVAAKKGVQHHGVGT